MSIWDDAQTFLGNLIGTQNTPGEASGAQQGGYYGAEEELRQKYGIGQGPMQDYLKQLQNMDLGGILGQMQKNMSDPQAYQQFLMGQYKEDPSLEGNIQQAKNVNNMSASASGLTGSSSNLGQNTQTEMGMREQDLNNFMNQANNLYQDNYNKLMGLYGNQEGLSTNLLKGEIGQEGQLQNLQNQINQNNLSYQGQQGINNYNTLGQFLPFLVNGGMSIFGNNNSSSGNYGQGYSQNEAINYGPINPRYNFGG